MKRIAGQVLLATGVLATLFVATRLSHAPRSSEAESGFSAEKSRWERQLAHTLPGSSAHFRAERKLQKLEAAESGRPAAGSPEIFHQVLHDMKVPSDREWPEYEPNYRRRELVEARKMAHKGTPLPWVSRGPFNVAGRARGLVVDSSDPTNDTWWVGSVGGGIWRTTDGGTSWQDMAPDLANINISWLVQAPSNADVFYAGTGESFFNIDTINGNGVLKSIDHGLNWSVLPSTVDQYDFNNISRIIVDPNDKDIVLVSTTTSRYKLDFNNESHIFRSTNGGTTWTDVYVETDIGANNRAKRVTQIIATPGNFNVQYAAIAEKGILKSVDAGQTWALSSTGITDFTGRFEIAISPANTSIVFASAQGQAHSELWRSTNAGASWTETVVSGGSEPNWLGAQGWYDNTIVCHPTNTAIVYVGGIRLWQLTMNPGANSRTHSLLSTGPVHVDHHNLVILDDGGGDWRILNANDGGIGVSKLFATDWSKPTDGMVTGQFYGADKRPGQDAYFGGMQDNGTWWSPIDSDASAPWTFAIGGDGYETSWHFDDPSKMIGGYQYNGFNRSLDGGLTWEPATNGLADTGSSAAPFLTKIGKSNLAPDRLFAVGASGVWRSEDFGGNWALATMNGADWGALNSFMDVRVSRADPDVVWAGARMDGTGKIHVSTDGGQSFDPTTNYTGATVGVISGMATHPTLPGTAFVLFSFAGRPKVLRTDDYGASWSDISGFEGGTPSTNGFPDVACYDLLVLPHDPDTIWVGSEIGLIESTDAGASWALADNGFPNIPIWFMTHVEDEVVLGTHGRGIWSASIPAMIAGLTFNPLLEKVYQSPDGILNLSIHLRSAYDQTKVLFDGVLQQELGANAAPVLTTLQFPVSSAGQLNVQLASTKSSQSYDSVIKTVDVELLAAPDYTYLNDFGAASSDFVGSGFSIETPAGFANPAIHSLHFYPDGFTHLYMLKQPIIVAPGNAVLSFDEICIVEPGEDGSQFGDENFWDYCVVEGTLDGCNWVPLLDGYDAREDVAWLNAFNSSSSGNSTMYRPRVINLHDTFAPGDRILVRFRLFADSFVNGWGWAIDNVAIQPNPTGTGDGQSPRRFALGPAQPNPFNPITTIEYQLAAEAKVELKVFDLRGRLVRTLIGGKQPGGLHSVRWDGRDGSGQSVASGVYVVRMAAGEFVQEQKVTLLK